MKQKTIKFAGVVLAVMAILLTIGCEPAANTNTSTDAANVNDTNFNEYNPNVANKAGEMDEKSEDVEEEAEKKDDAPIPEATVRRSCPSGTKPCGDSCISQDQDCSY